MGLKLYPVEEGDEERYEVFTITFHEPWKPRAYQEGKSAYMTQNATNEKPHKIIQNVQIEGNNLNYYDPSDNDEPIYGTEAELTFDDQAVLNMDEVGSEAQIYAAKAWN